MEDPILEALTFSLDSELHVKDDGGSKTGVNLNKPNSPPSSSSLISGASSSSISLLNEPILCIIPDCSFLGDPVKPGTKVSKSSNILEHLLCVHNFVIDEVDEVANLNKYFSYWRERFRGKNFLMDFCVSFLMDRPLINEQPIKGCPPAPADSQKLSSQSQPSQQPQQQQTLSKDNDKFYMLTPVLDEDKKLREKLWNNRLERILEINAMEREQTDFSRQCLFCRDILTGNRLNLFTHMADAHSFYIGKPDNVVFVNELLDFINDKLDACECIYCGKTYKDKTVLRAHMRKKAHKRIKPENGEYDRFYIVNYLEPGKTWKALDEEEQEDDRREEEWMETRDEETSIVCLFCSFQNINYDSILSHMLAEHNFDFNTLTSQLNFYQKVKIVNFIRRNTHQNICVFCEKQFSDTQSLLTHLVEHRQDSTSVPFPRIEIWDRAEYFFPTYENDQFLILLDRGNDEERDQNLETDSRVVIPEDLPNVCENSFLKSEFPSS